LISKIVVRYCTPPPRELRLVKRGNDSTLAILGAAATYMTEGWHMSCQSAAHKSKS